MKKSVNINCKVDFDMIMSLDGVSDEDIDDLLSNKIEQETFSKELMEVMINSMRENAKETGIGFSVSSFETGFSMKYN